MTDWAIISLGNRYRGDDGVGPFVLQRLRDRFGNSVDCIENSGDMTRLLEDWRDRHVCLVDAVSAEEREAGDIVLLDGLAEPMPPSLCGTSSHGFSLAEALELGRLFDSLPRRLAIYAICGENFANSAALSPAVEAAAVNVEKEILHLLTEQTGGPRCTNSP
ncbi:hydrogenase maturation protease [Microbulbifer hainanensis]|uniref:hydrogenase maturation protease n=1 Tax=Microbulbifer hainanensis TaxID=2735675 RepID=UPI0018695653|nr:hydrogenase maturation protease [Microbulbifer hainanensis]